ncbi:hypothetical protein MMC11_007416 [Xylographa trunciseda]|nr:hypothetical protein [Xylographa trunciseda]
MSSSTLTSRFDAYVAAHNSHDVARLMSFMASYHDSESFTTWGWDLDFKYMKPSPMLPGVEVKGQILPLKGVSLIWWVMEAGEWKVEKGCDYASFVKE